MNPINPVRRTLAQIKALLSAQGNRPPSPPPPIPVLVESRLRRPGWASAGSVVLSDLQAWHLPPLDAAALAIVPALGPDCVDFVRDLNAWLAARSGDRSFLDHSCRQVLFALLRLNYDLDDALLYGLTRHPMPDDVGLAETLAALISDGMTALEQSLLRPPTGSSSLN